MEVMILLTLINLIMCLVVGAVGVYAWVELKSFMKSTHNVQFLPLETSQPPLKHEPLRDQDLNEYDL